MLRAPFIRFTGAPADRRVPGYLLGRGGPWGGQANEWETSNLNRLLFMRNSTQRNDDHS
jgi:hypothetical protein